MIFHKLTINRVVLLIYIFAIIYFVTALITNDTIKLWLSVAVGTVSYCYLIVAYWQKNRLVSYSGDCKVIFDGAEVCCAYDNGKEFRMKWNDVRRITAMKSISKNEHTSSETWLRFHSYPWRKVLSVPWRAQNFQSLYDKISAFENFEDARISELRQSERKASLVLWEKED